MGNFISSRGGSKDDFSCSGAYREVVVARRTRDFFVRRTLSREEAVERPHEKLLVLPRHRRCRGRTRIFSSRITSSEQRANRFLCHFTCYYRSKDRGAIRRRVVFSLAFYFFYRKAKENRSLKRAHDSFNMIIFVGSLSLRNTQLRLERGTSPST